MLKKRDLQLIAELLKNSKRSDRELAKALKASQPTITRARRRIERKGLIRNYTVIPNLQKLGFEVMAFTFTKMRPEILSEKMIEKVKEYAARFPNAIFATTGEGMGMTGVIVSLHKNYREYAQKLALFRMDWGQYMENIQSFVTVSGEGEVKPLSFAYLANALPDTLVI